MFGRKIKTAVASAALFGLAAAPVMAGATSTTTQDLQQQIASLQKQVAQLQQSQQQNQSWLNQRKKAEVKSLVQDVMKDASSRSSMLQEGATAGISDDGKIFLRSADGSWSFNPYGLVQVQYIYNNIQNGGAIGSGSLFGSSTSGNETPKGFQLGAVRFGANGYIGNPHIGYHFELSATPTTSINPFLGTSSTSTSVNFDEYTVFYKFDNGFKITGGRFKQPFSRSTLTNDGHQLAIDRSPVEYFFGAQRSQGAMVSYKTNKLFLRAAINNGSDAFNSFALGVTGLPVSATSGAYSTYRDAPADFAVTARADYKVSGDWSQLDDSFNSWTGTGQAIFIGAGVDFESGNSNNVANVIGHLIKYTVDASLQQNGLSLYVAGFGEHINASSTFGGLTADNFGVIAQAGYFVVPDKVQPFVRYSGLFLDNGSFGSSSLGSTTLNTLTAGINWYQHRQNAKFTLDGVYVFNKFTGLGALSNTLSSTTEQGEIAIRAQYQLMF